MPKRVREPKFVRIHEDDAATRMRAGLLVLAMLVIGGLMYVYRDRVPIVADVPNPSPMSQPSTTGAAPTR